MCGNATELKWFYDLGFQVVGVEFLEDVVRQFFDANQLDVLENNCPVTGCKILQTSDGMLKVYICDLYAFTKECAGLMDIIWDRGGLVSVRLEDRTRYVALMRSLVAPGFSYGLYTTEYDDPTFSGFPKNVDLPLIKELYGDDFEVTRLGVTFIERSYVKNRIIKETLWHMKQRNAVF